MVEPSLGTRQPSVIASEPAHACQTKLAFTEGGKTTKLAKENYIF